MAFFDQKRGLTLLEKGDFGDFKRLNFLWPKIVSFLSKTLLNTISSLIFTENKWIKKWHFLTKKHGLTPLEKCDFWDFKILHFLWPQMVCSVSKTILYLFSSLILTENK